MDIKEHQDEGELGPGYSSVSHPHKLVSSQSVNQSMETDRCVYNFIHAMWECNGFDVILYL